MLWTVLAVLGLLMLAGGCALAFGAGAGLIVAGAGLILAAIDGRN